MTKLDRRCQDIMAPKERKEKINKIGSRTSGYVKMKKQKNI